MTPLVDADAKADGDDSPDADDWNAAFKLEYVFPTGSFKDRGATTTLTRARELGVERVVEDSSGNAGAAIATYAARAGIDAAVYVPADVKDSKLRAIRRAGAEPVRIEGSRADVTEACVAALGEGDGGGGAAGAAGADEKAIPPTPRGTPATRGIRRSSRGPPPSPTRSRSSATGRPPTRS